MVVLCGYFEEFIRAKIAEGKYNNASEVIRTRLRLLGENESRLAGLKASIRAREKSGEAVDFHPEQHQKSPNAVESLSTMWNYKASSLGKRLFLGYGLIHPYSTFAL